MTAVRVAAAGSDVFARGMAAIREEMDVPGPFPADVVREAANAVAEQYDATGRTDRTDLPMVTLDPADATDLDQAFALEQDGDDFVLLYAIADLSAFVVPGGALERELWQRGVTVYLPANKVNLHPPVLAEGAASLLPGDPRPAVLLTVRVDPDGKASLAGAERAMVRSRSKLAYETIAPGELPATLAPFAERVRAAEDRRGAGRVEFPEQEVVTDPARPGQFLLQLRPRRPSEDDTATLSLAANLAVADALRTARTGLFRVMEEPDERELRTLRHTARALDLDWPAELDVRAFQRSLDTSDTRAAAVLLAVRRAGGAASYAPYTDGVVPWHAAIAASYVHATAPLRRLADRYVLDAAVAVSAGDAVPGYVTAAFQQLPEVMRRADSRAAKVDRAVIDFVEAVALHGHEGEQFEATVLDADRGAARVQLRDLAVVAHVDLKRVEPGDRVRLTLRRADPEARKVEFTPH